MLPEAKLDILLAHHASLEAQLLGQVNSESYVRITRELAELNPLIDAVKAYRAANAEGVGEVLARGPNVMLGYVKAERPGVLEPPPDGWHDTGDIVTIDPQGFVTIKGRAKRFAKVGGEMISLAAVEALAGDLWPQHPCAVVAVADARKGERLILATQKKDATRPEFMAFAKQQHAADLMIPSEIMIFEHLPMLGSGKVDLVTLAKEVGERVAAKPEAMARAQA